MHWNQQFYFLMSLLLLEVKKVDIAIYGFPKGIVNRPCAGVPGYCCSDSLLGLLVISCTGRCTTRHGNSMPSHSLPFLLSGTWSCPFLQTLFTQDQHHHLLS